MLTQTNRQTDLLRQTHIDTETHTLDWPSDCVMAWSMSLLTGPMISRAPQFLWRDNGQSDPHTPFLPHDRKTSTEGDALLLELDVFFSFFFFKLGRSFPKLLTAGGLWYTDSSGSCSFLFQTSVTARPLRVLTVWLTMSSGYFFFRAQIYIMHSYKKQDDRKSCNSVVATQTSMGQPHSSEATFYKAPLELWGLESSFGLRPIEGTQINKQTKT